MRDRSVSVSRQARLINNISCIFDGGTQGHSLNSTRLRRSPPLLHFREAEAFHNPGHVPRGDTRATTLCLA
ncbi:hypothetical protein E2C01_062830 [Portunus trituberculatus]|uniref:Uncharacterized protein n=1 Tax=Portunus trituberculatus TaxID=210409 RepID=A0A5B7HH60_PORTR|nr:hypothetical protein [Portunus trituberculatus]